ncbi:MAG: hypothetical protein ACRDRH_26460 [Pseudonocardia sp.]
MVVDLRSEYEFLHAAVRVLAAACPQMTGGASPLVDRFVNLVPPPPTTRASLRAFLGILRAHPQTVHALFSTSLVDDRRAT